MANYIDGYNLLFRYFRSGSLEDSRKAMLRSLTLPEATIVFDAPFSEDDEQVTNFGRYRVVYTRKGQTADEWILQYAREKDTLYTEDRELAAQARLWRVTILPLKGLLPKAAIQEEEKPRASRWIERYLKIFENKLE